MLSRDCPGIKLEAATDEPNNWEFLIFQRPWPRNWLLDQQNKNFRFDCCIKSISQVFVDRNRFGVTSSGSATTQTFQFSNGSMEHWSELVDNLLTSDSAKLLNSHIIHENEAKVTSLDPIGAV